MSQQFHHIPSLLNAAELITLEELIPQAEFTDGKATAGMSAKEVKNNMQLKPSDAVMNSIQQLLNTAIQSSPYFNIAAQPKKVFPFIISKYQPGQYYGWHVDSPIMGDPMIRTDMAMTIFLSDPSTYEGGELVIQTSFGPVPLKPAKGDAILYPCQFLHCVNEVKKGERLAAVTWVQSNIQSTEQRQILFELNQVHALLQQRDKHAPETNQLLQTYSNLFRMWADV
ncbi:MAG TPA: Fe2+-dependent dioxygenase [Chitinophagaceae bacterium]|nr:Fe2+-dependent dioxygenase [Chitinophagaceae bacterium]